MWVNDDRIVFFRWTIPSTFLHQQQSYSGLFYMTKLVWTSLQICHNIIISHQCGIAGQNTLKVFIFSWKQCHVNASLITNMIITLLEKPVVHNLLHAFCPFIDSSYFLAKRPFNKIEKQTSALNCIFLLTLSLWIKLKSLFIEWWAPYSIKAWCIKYDMKWIFQFSFYILSKDLMHCSVL